MKPYTLSWHEKPDPSCFGWTYKRITIYNPDLIKILLSQTDFCRLLFGDNLIYALQLEEGEQTIPYKGKKKRR